MGARRWKQIIYDDGGDSMHEGGYVIAEAVDDAFLRRKAAKELAARSVRTDLATRLGVWLGGWIGRKWLGQG